MRSPRAISAAFVAAVVAGSSLQGAQRSRPDLIAVVDVAATAPWTDTGIAVRIGDHVRIRAWGAVKLADRVSGPGIGPQGSGGRGGGCTYVVSNSRVPAHSLVGNVAPGITLDGG